jgi:hypothetical protein
MIYDAGDTRRVAPEAEPRTTDLYGRAPQGGRPILWKRAMHVVPVNSFACNGHWIRSGHYVIDHNGDAIVVHCANLDGTDISVQFVHDELTTSRLPRALVESMLLGRVLVCPEQQAAVCEGQRWSDMFLDG